MFLFQIWEKWHALRTSWSNICDAWHPRRERHPQKKNRSRAKWVNGHDWHWNWPMDALLIGLRGKWITYSVSGTQETQNRELSRYRKYEVSQCQRTDVVLWNTGCGPSDPNHARLHSSQWQQVKVKLRLRFRSKIGHRPHFLWRESSLRWPDRVISVKTCAKYGP